ncbi:Site-specific recombinase XerD [Ekhidna lutea]|uniref:Site-specific recombinase XerD n=1 Tax=Ekhidna lutea TaxID=447679 RepID=A0A239LGA2_EKHLU|nr:site-specific integrase [Ekhidna lutea]SNT28938.1 Site-specific recombinase XerD [Ekhidna lutea]
MATVKALIRQNKVNSNGQAVIYLRYGHHQKVKDISSGVKVVASQWDEKNQKVNSTKGIRKTKLNEDLIESKRQSDLIVNTKIEHAKSRILQIARKLQLNKIDPEVGLVKNKYFEKESPTPRVDLELIPLFEDFVKKTSKSDGTKANYRTAIYHLEKYQTAKLKSPLRLSNISLDLIDDFRRFLHNDLVKPGGKEKGISDNSAGTSLRNIKVFLNYLIDRNYDVPDIASKIKVPRIDKTIIYLTENEIDQLYYHTFQKTKYERVRDVFVLNCYTGLRYSDLQRLNKNHIHDEAIVMRAYKNQNDLFVPLTKRPLEILDKYNYELPQLSEQKFNSYIKEACDIAKIHSQVELIKTSSGNKSYKYEPKWKTITSHIAIKTFISLCGKKGISPKAVSEITGKSVEIIIKHYYGIDKETIKEQMRSAFS